MIVHASPAIIPFPQDRARKPMAGECVMGPADVLIFTGVQVERLEPGAVSPQPQKPRRPACKAGEAS